MLGRKKPARCQEKAGIVYGCDVQEALTLVCRREGSESVRLLQ